MRDREYDARFARDVLAALQRHPTSYVDLPVLQTVIWLVWRFEAVSRYTTAGLPLVVHIRKQLTFLRMMGLVEKNSRGDYRLTRKGRTQQPRYL